MDTRLHTPCTSLTIKQRKKKKRKKRQTLTYILQPSGHASRVKRNLRERTALSLPRPPLSLSIFLRPVERVYIREEAANFSASQDLYTHTHMCVLSRTTCLYGLLLFSGTSRRAYKSSVPLFVVASGGLI